MGRLPPLASQTDWAPLPDSSANALLCVCGEENCQACLEGPRLLLSCLWFPPTGNKPQAASYRTASKWTELLEWGYCIDKKTEDQRGETTLPRPHRTDLSLEPGVTNPRGHLLVGTAAGSESLTPATPQLGSLGSRRSISCKQTGLEFEGSSGLLCCHPRLCPSFQKWGAKK